MAKPDLPEYNCQAMERMDRHQEMLSMSDSKQEYWGPVSKDFTDAYLDVIYENLRKSLGKRHKTVFFAVSEMLHNITTYNIQNFKEDFPPSYVSIELLKNTAVLCFHNVVLVNAIEDLTDRFNALLSINADEIKKLYKKRIIENESLGLLLLKKHADTNFHWEFIKEKDKDWLKILITVNHGSTSN